MILALTLFLIVLCLILLHDFVRKSGRSWALLSKFPGDFPLPIIGNALQLGFDADEASHKLVAMWRKHGEKTFRITVGSEEWVMLCEPDDVGVILSHPTELSKPLERNAAIMPFFGNSLSSSEGERWQSTRKLMTPSFHFKVLEQRVGAVNKFTNHLVEILNKFEGKGPVDMYRYLRPFMFDVLCNTLMGVDFNLLDNPDHPYMIASGKVDNIITMNYFSYWRNIRPIFILTQSYREMMDSIRTIRKTSDEIIAKRRAILNKIIEDTKSNNKNINISVEELIQDKLSDETCLLDNLLLSKLPSGDPILDEMINEEISLICFTGQYTTTMTISHTLYCLAKYPEIQQRVIDEQRSIFGHDIMKNPTYHDLNDMKYLEAVIKETIRKIPTVTKIGRQLKGDLQLKDGRIIPAGSSAIVYYEAMYLDPKVYPEPEKYIPERFFNSGHQFAFVPFSAGPRNCIGFRYAWVAMKATLSNIIRRFEVIEGGPGFEPKFAHRIITESVNGLNLRLKNRVY